MWWSLCVVGSSVDVRVCRWCVWGPVWRCVCVCAFAAAFCVCGGEVSMWQPLCLRGMDRYSSGGRLRVVGNKAWTPGRLL